MNPLVLALCFLASAPQESVPRTQTVQFAASTLGHNVTVCIDGRKVESAFAGRLSFRDGSHQWFSYCADVRSPVVKGQFFNVRILSTDKLETNIRRAGNIVSKYFYQARTADDCAAIQLAVWEAIEDGGPHADFRNGAFQVRANASVIALAEQVYEAGAEDGKAVLLRSGGSGQSQITLL